MAQPRSLAHLKREISEKKWPKPEAGQDAESGKKYKLTAKQRPDGTVAGSSKRLSSRFYQPKTGRPLASGFTQRLQYTFSRYTSPILLWPPRPLPF
jgi:hypothetical protein